jgi:hypothetical protein
MVAAAAASSPTDVWAFTAKFGLSRALRWNGQQWTVMRSFSRSMTVNAVALIPGTTQVLAVGDTHDAANPGAVVVGVILQYES